MDFGLTVHTDITFKNRTQIIHLLSEDLRSFFIQKSYGEDLNSLVIGLVILSPQFDAIYKESKPKYYQGKSSITHDGITIEIENALEYTIKPEYIELVSAEENVFLKKLASEILQSLDKIDTIKKIKCFDKMTFKTDLEAYFKNRNLI